MTHDEYVRHEAEQQKDPIAARYARGHFAHPTGDGWKCGICGEAREYAKQYTEFDCVPKPRAVFSGEPTPKPRQTCECAKCGRVALVVCVTCDPV